MRASLAIVMLAAAFGALAADETPRRKDYECRYAENPPYGVGAWSQSEMVRTGAEDYILKDFTNNRYSLIS